MIRWLKRIFRESDRFAIPPSRRPLPKCRLRPLDDSEFDACIEIYRLNEPGRFPAGYLDHFSDFIRSGRNLFLVCEVDRCIRGFGGVSMHQKPETEVATLNFGMIHPEHHRQGYGTALLLARLATLPPPDLQWVALISTTGGSENFYRRFGFIPDRRFTDERGTKFDQYRTRIYKQDWQACRNALAAASVTLETSGVTIPPIHNG